MQKSQCDTLLHNLPSMAMSTQSICLLLSSGIKHSFDRLDPRSPSNAKREPCDCACTKSATDLCVGESIFGSKFEELADMFAAGVSLEIRKRVVCCCGGAELSLDFAAR